MNIFRKKRRPDCIHYEGCLDIVQQRSPQLWDTDCFSCNRYCSRGRAMTRPDVIGLLMMRASLDMGISPDKVKARYQI